MPTCVISGTGLFTPEHYVPNELLVETFNQYVDIFNHQNKAAILNGLVQAKEYSDAKFIEQASGIQGRYLLYPEGVLNPEIMQPMIPETPNDQPSCMVRMALEACEQALLMADVSVSQVDLIIVAASNMERAYPAMAIELQHYLDCTGMAFDMNVACSSATFGLQTAVSLIESGRCRAALVVNPEICSAHLNFCDRDSHFIFGDACTASLVQRQQDCQVAGAFEFVSGQLATTFSNNIRNNAGFLNRCSPDTRFSSDKLFVQEGRRVFRELLPLVVENLSEHLEKEQVKAKEIKRFWLHQANQTMNMFVAKKILGREATQEEAPLVLQEYGNTSSAGCIIAFHKYHEDLKSGDLAILSSFGAGYSTGSLLLRRY